MSSRALSSFTNGWKRRGALVAFLAVLPLPLVALAQPTVEEQELLLRLKQQLTEAERLFDDPTRQSQSIDFLTQIIRAAETEQRARGTLSEELTAVVERARELRAIAYFNAGERLGAEEDFRQIILTNARKALDRELLSPKIVDFFEDQKKKLVGYIAVTTEPAGARVTVDGEFYGLSNLFPQDIIVGQHRVEISLTGYDAVVREVRILPQETLPLDLVLTRNSAALPIITQPADVEILVNGESRGRTSGSLRPEFRSFIDSAAYDVEQLSDVFQLSPLALGPHVIELRKECYEPVRFQLSVEAPQDYTAQIHKLEESIGRIRLTSTPVGARVFLDGQYKGNTPLDLNRVCSGTHRLEVKHATGKYLDDFVLEKNDALALDCPIRPSLGFLGIVADEGVPVRDREDIRQKVAGEFQKMTAMNLIMATPEQLQSVLGRDAKDLWAFVSRDVTPGRTEFSKEIVRDLSEKLASALEVEALLVGYVPAQRLTKDVWLNLLAKASARPDAYLVNYLNPDAVPGFISKLSTPTPIYSNWIGLTAIDTRLTSGPVVLEVAPDGPSASAGIALGAVVTAVDGVAVQGTRELLEKIRAKEPGSTVSLKLQTKDAASDVTVQVGRTSLEIPLNQPGFLYNKAIIDMRHRMAAEPSNEPLARLNLALGHIELGDFETALKEHLPKIRLQGGRGICQGTVYYYMGLSYQMLGEKADAAQWYKEALKYAEATVQTNDGPRVQPLAERKLREIGQ